MESYRVQPSLVDAPLPSTLQQVPSTLAMALLPESPLKSSDLFSLSQELSETKTSMVATSEHISNVPTLER